MLFLFHMADYFVDGKHESLAEIVNVKLIRVRWVMTEALPESERKLSNEICGVRDCFYV